MTYLLWSLQVRWLKRKIIPRLYEVALYELYIHLDRCIVRKDSLDGLLFAKSSGLRTVITPSFSTLDENFSKADLVLTSLTNFKICGQGSFVKVEQ